MAINSWCCQRLAQLSMENTDEQYEEQYDKLFPNYNIEESGYMEALNSAAPAEEAFLGALKFAYLDCWKAGNRIPSVYDLEEYMVDYINELCVAYMDKVHEDDPQYWSDDSYREDVIDDCVEDTNADYAYQGLEFLIAECLVWLNYTAIIDYDKEGGYEYVICAQGCLIPSRDNNFERGGI